MERFHVSPARLAAGVVAIAGIGAAGGGVANAVAAQTGSRSLAGALAALVAKHAGPMPMVGQSGIPLVKVNPNGTLDLSAPSPAHCHFAPSTKKGATPGTISDAHRSTSVPGAIKVNSYIVCDHRVQALTNETQLWKTGFLFNHLQAQHTTDNSGRAILANLGTYRRCTNTKRTTWYGVAYGVSAEGGQLYEGYGASPHDATFDCGT
jgi:hypothetical protein